MAFFRTFIAIASLSLCVSLGAFAQKTEKKVALVIGNAAYIHASPLVNPTNDTADMKTALEALGFEVSLHVNLTKAKMELAVHEFAQALKGASATVGALGLTAEAAGLEADAKEAGEGRLKAGVSARGARIVAVGSLSVGGVPTGCPVTAAAIAGALSTH